ncbi:hypothetical protein H5410_004965 [Solanum commersonii]|uniref:Uncharacterized protein n=1 Tax=Solanum commersonii TaxID=4109 RepID=A0A9J6A640_SOLCO|nr:hypothetical protein H5410_004965 [Solanum commersonii]
MSHKAANASVKVVEDTTGFLRELIKKIQSKLQRHGPQIVEWKGGSQVWKLMFHARDNIDYAIWWERPC